MVCGGFQIHREREVLTSPVGLHLSRRICNPTGSGGFQIRREQTEAACSGLQIRHKREVL